MKRLLIFSYSVAVSALMPAHAVDGVAVELGAGHTDAARLSVNWTWDKRWLQSETAHVGGRWEVSIEHWRAKNHGGVVGVYQQIAVLGLTPVFRFQSNSGKGWYAEAGIGIRLLSDLYDSNDRQLSTRFQFADHVAIGYAFENKLDIALKFQHVSNGGLKKPNDGVDTAMLRFGYQF